MYLSSQPLLTHVVRSDNVQLHSDMFSDTAVISSNTLITCVHSTDHCSKSFVILVILFDYLTLLIGILIK